MLAVPSQGHAQVERMPQELQRFLDEVGPRWGTGLNQNIADTIAAYDRVLRKSPRSGIEVIGNLCYGDDAAQCLDLYRRPGLRAAPIVVFVHGGAYVSGDKNVSEQAYGNVSRYFARRGYLAVNANYRLAPAAPWPAGAEDVRALVRWLRANAIRLGGDPERIVLIGHSAGATHVASYAMIPELSGPEGPEIAGIVLMSGRYAIEASPGDPRASQVSAYFGTDSGLYAERSVLSYVGRAPRLPTFIVTAEYDNPGLDVQGARLFAALCQRDSACPRFTRMVRHNHLSMVLQFDTADEALGREVGQFIDRLGKRPGR